MQVSTDEMGAERRKEKKKKRKKLREEYSPPHER
jgi:hypothetical protein